MFFTYYVPTILKETFKYENSLIIYSLSATPNVYDLNDLQIQILFLIAAVLSYVWTGNASLQETHPSFK